LDPWEQLTLGAPSALEELPEAEETAAAVAALVGGQRGLMATSMLHLSWDLLEALPEGPLTLYADEGSYPIARWGLERAAWHGVPVQSFSHHDPDRLAHLLRRDARRRRRPVVVTDGYCPGCGQQAPLGAYLEAVRRHGGLLVLDDTQALGLLGLPGAATPYGTGGGGSLRWSGLTGPDIVWRGSLAKALGVPVAAVVGSAAAISRHAERSETRVHCSPPSVAHLHAARHALEVNAREGDTLRKRLAQRIQAFRDRLAAAGLSVGGQHFPVQRLIAVPGVDPRRLQRQLERKGVTTVLQRSRCGPEVSVSFILTARHSEEDVEQATDALIEAVREVAQTNPRQWAKR